MVLVPRHIAPPRRLWVRPDAVRRRPQVQDDRPDRHEETGQRKQHSERTQHSAEGALQMTRTRSDTTAAGPVEHECCCYPGMIKRPCCRWEPHWLVIVTKAEVCREVRRVHRRSSLPLSPRQHVVRVTYLQMKASVVHLAMRANETKRLPCAPE